jgi:hypothetical protein
MEWFHSFKGFRLRGSWELWGRGCMFYTCNARYLSVGTAPEPLPIGKGRSRTSRLCFCPLFIRLLGGGVGEATLPSVGELWHSC